MSMITVENSCLIVIDVQGKLANLMHSQTYLPHVKAMIKAAQILQIPILITEQAPEKIGHTIAEIQELLPEISPIIKQTFSCCGEPQFMDVFHQLRRNHVVIVGIEAHVCIYQTVRDLLRNEQNVHVIVDAISSRSAHNATIGIKRCEDEGATLTTVEMVITELIASTRHPKFKEVMALLKENK